MNVTICEVQISTDKEGRFRINDIHEAALASGVTKDIRPNEWLALGQTNEIIKTLTTENPESKPTSSKAGRYGGTYVVKELVYAYAMWVSPKFNLHVIRAFDAMVTKAAQPEPTGLPRPIGETVDAIEKIFNMLNVCQTSRVGLSRRYFSKNATYLLEVLPDYTVDSSVITSNSSDATLSLTALLEREGASIKTPQANLKITEFRLVGEGSNSNWLLLDGN